MLNFYVITLGKMKVTFTLDGREHMWSVYFTDVDKILNKNSEPDMKITQAKGNAVLKFLREYEKRQLGQS